MSSEEIQMLIIKNLKYIYEEQTMRLDQN